MFFTYILQSEKDQSFYVGFSENVASRLVKHNNAKKGYTATKQPWKLVYTKEFKSKTEAIKREKFIKAQKSREFIQILSVKLVRIPVPSKRSWETLQMNTGMRLS